MNVTKVTWAKMHGVSRAAITLAVSRGALVEAPDGTIDDKHATNRAWVDRRSSRKAATKAVERAETKKPSKDTTKGQKLAPGPATRQPAAKKPKEQDAMPAPLPIDADTPAPPVEDDDEGQGQGLESLGLLSIEKIMAEIRYKHEAAEAYRIKRLASLGLLVEREQVRQVIGKFNAELRVRLLEMPGTITPRLVAMARSGTSDHEIARLLEDEIARAIESAKSVVSRAGLQGGA